MKQKQIRQVRKAVRESLGFKIKSFLDLVPKDKDYRMTAAVARLWYSEARLPREQQIRYLVSKGNFITLKARTEEDFHNSMDYLRAAYEDAVEEVERIARNNCAWQKLSKSEQSEAILQAYAKNSNQSRDEDECWQGQQEITKKSSALNSGSPNPEYDLGLLRRIRSGLRYWAKNIARNNNTPATIFLEQKESYLKHLDEILEVRK